jgi:Asp-tRNA(Asn)/Glu-tRNA(Gln) amidotransferase C subunit
VFREDGVDNNFQVEESVGNAPERKGPFFKVPPIIEVD